MKKISSILLVLVIASTMIFASFSGSATVNLGYNLDSSEYGFINGDSAKVSFELFKIVAEKEGDQDIAVRLKAELAGKWSFGGDDGAPMKDQKDQNFKVKFNKLVAEVFSGDMWLVGITGMYDVADYAKSSLDKMTDKDGNSDKVAATARVDVKKTAGIYAKVMGFKVSVGAHGWVYNARVPAEKDKKKDENKLQHSAAVTFETPEFEFVEGLKTQATINYSLTKKKKTGSKLVHAVGGGVKLSYEVEDLGKFSVASDAYFSTEGVKSKHIKDLTSLGNENKNKVGVDAAITVDFAPITFDLFYANLYKDNYKDKTYNDHLLSAQVVADLNKYEVPVKLTVWAKDVLKSQNVGVKVETTVLDDALTIAVNGGVELGYDFVGKLISGTAIENKEKWHAGLDVTYKHEYFTVSTGASVKAPFAAMDMTNIILGAKAEVSTDKLVDGATFGLKYSDAKDLFNAEPDPKKKNHLGKVNLYCKIGWK